MTHSNPDFSDIPLGLIQLTGRRVCTHRLGQPIVLILSLPHFLHGFMHYRRLAEELQGESRCKVQEAEIQTDEPTSTSDSSIDFTEVSRFPSLPSR